MIFVDWFAPGFKGGGQIQSCVNLAIALQDDMDVFVVTTDRDLGSTISYETIMPDEWNNFDRRIKVLYLSPQKLGFKSIKGIIRSTAPDVIYLNSMFSFSLTLLPLEACRLENWKTKIILAPRGMLHQGALQYKKLKKQLFFRAFKVRRFHRRILFHATDKTEEADIRTVFGKDVRSEYIADFPASGQGALKLIEKVSGILKCVFVSRISPKKNLILILKLLKRAQGNILFTIVGPTEDEEYWAACQEEIRSMPSNVQVEYAGAIANHDLPAVYRNNHLFMLPTFGENFGHVIYESLSNGRPVLISDQTPWKELFAQHAGWAIPLVDEEGFSGALQHAINWNQAEFNSWCEGSLKLASEFSDTTALAKQYLGLFQ